MMRETYRPNNCNNNTFIEVSFPAVWRDGKFFRLDMVTEVTHPIYVCQFSQEEIDNLKQGGIGHYYGNQGHTVLCRAELTILHLYY